MTTRTPLRTTALALACTLAGLFATAQAAETPKTLSSGELKVGMEITYPPFEYYEGDQVKGFDPEVSAALAKRLGLEASFSDITFPNLILGLDAGRFDTIISGMYILPERLEKADAIPYAKTGAALMVRSDASQALLSGHIQAHLEIDAASLLIVEKSRGRIAISSKGSIYPQVLGIYVKKGNAQLLDALKAALDDFKASGEYAELLKKYNLEEA